MEELLDEYGEAGTEVLATIFGVVFFSSMIAAGGMLTVFLINYVNSICG